MLKNLSCLYFIQNLRKLTLLAFQLNLTYVKYLGFYIDENLTWGTHINELSKKLSRANGVLAKLRYFTPKKILLLVYYAIFYSQLLYGCPV